MLYDMLTTGQRDNQIPVQVLAIRIPSGRVMEMVGRPAGKEAQIVRSTHQAARPDAYTKVTWSAA
jgi:hypothetical protein